MLGLPNSIKVYVYSKHVDMRKAFNGLSVIIKHEFNKNPLVEDGLFVFFNRKHNKVKIMYWDRTGFAMWYKVLQNGKFKLPSIEKSTYKLSISELNLLLEGIELTNKNRHKSI